MRFAKRQLHLHIASKHDCKHGNLVTLLTVFKALVRIASKFNSYMYYQSNIQLSHTTRARAAARSEITVSLKIWRFQRSLSNLGSTPQDFPGS